jgi:hypothetical protein
MGRSDAAASSWWSGRRAAGQVRASERKNDCSLEKLASGERSVTGGKKGTAIAMDLSDCAAGTLDSTSLPCRLPC